MKSMEELGLGGYPPNPKPLFTDEEKPAIKDLGGGSDEPKWADLERSERAPRRITEEEREAAWKELIRMCIRGCTIKQAALALQVHPSTIWKWRKDPDFRIKLARTRALIIEKAQLADDLGESPDQVAKMDIEQIIEKASMRALEKLIEKLESPNEHIQLKAAIDLADRNPKMSKTKKIQGIHAHAIMTPQQLALIARAAREAVEDHDAGKVLEAVPIEELGDAVMDETL